MSPQAKAARELRQAARLLAARELEGIYIQEADAALKQAALTYAAACVAVEQDIDSPVRTR